MSAIRMNPGARWQTEAPQLPGYGRSIPGAVAGRVLFIAMPDKATILDCSGQSSLTEMVDHFLAPSRTSPLN